MLGGETGFEGAAPMKIITYYYLLLNTEILIMKEFLTCGWG
jgi:hypothetical protein